MKNNFKIKKRLHGLCKKDSVVNVYCSLSYIFYDAPPPPLQSCSRNSRNFSKQFKLFIVRPHDIIFALQGHVRKESGGVTGEGETDRDR